jgi:hypothetical protein
MIRMEMEKNLSIDQNDSSVYFFKLLTANVIVDERDLKCLPFFYILFSVKK